MRLWLLPLYMHMLPRVAQQTEYEKAKKNGGRLCKAHKQQPTLVKNNRQTIGLSNGKQNGTDVSARR